MAPGPSRLISGIQHRRQFAEVEVVLAYQDTQRPFREAGRYEEKLDVPDTSLVEPSKSVERGASARLPATVKARLSLLLVLLLCGGGITLFSVVSLLASPQLYEMDILQDYLMGKAVAAGANPYTPVAELAETYLGQRVGPTHPSPHPPLVALIFLPLSYLPFQNVATLWFVLELLMLAAALHILLRAGSIRLSIPATMLVALAVCAWAPIRFELGCGQYGIFTLLLLGLSYYMLGAKRALVAGVFLGLAVRIKFMPWPAILIFFLRRQWGVALSASLTVAAGGAVSIQLIGYDATRQYILDVLPLVNDLFGRSLMNISVWAVGWRAWEGSNALWPAGFYVPPVVDIGSASSAITPVMVGALLLVACIQAVKFRGERDALAAAVAISIPISPLVWSHAATIALLPLIHVACQRRGKLAPKWLWSTLGVIIIVLAVPIQAGLFVMMVIQGEYGIGDVHLPSVANVLPLSNTLAILGIYWLVYATGDKCETHANEV